MTSPVHVVEPVPRRVGGIHKTGRSMRIKADIFRQYAFRSTACTRFAARLPQVLLFVVMSLGVAPAFSGELGELLWQVMRHPKVLAAQNRSDAANRNLASSTALYFGNGGLTAQTSTFEDQRFVGVFSPDSLANPPFARPISRYGVSYTLPVDLAGAIAATRKAAKHTAEAIELAERQVILLKLHDATSAYVQLQSLQRQLAVLEVQRERVQRTVDRVSAEVATEQASIAELSLAQAEMARFISDNVRLQGAFQKAQASLVEAVENRLLPSSDKIAVPPWPAVVKAELLPAEIAREQELAVAARAEQVRRSLLPGVSVGADFFEFNGGGHSPDAWSLNLMVNVPLNISAWKQAGAARAEARASVFSREAASRAAKQNWTALHVAYESAIAETDALEKEIEAREEVVRVQAELRRVGMASLEDYLRQLRDRLVAESRHAEARARAVISWSAAQILLGSNANEYITALDSARPGK